MANVFISFIHEEAEYAEAVQAFITQVLGADAKPFLSSDQMQIYAGEKWLDKIMNELKCARVVLLMLSEISVQRPWVNFEAGAAWTRDIITIPTCFGKLRKGELPKPYSSLQAVDLNSYGDDEYLAVSVAHHLGIEKPIGRVLSGMYGILGGEEGARKAKMEEAAFKYLEERLIHLNDMRFSTGAE
jgi:TIR domain-containing protein